MSLEMILSSRCAKNGFTMIRSLSCSMFQLFLVLNLFLAVGNATAEPSPSAQTWLEFAERPILPNVEVKGNTALESSSVQPEWIQFERVGVPQWTFPVGLGRSQDDAEKWVETLTEPMIQNQELFEKAYGYALIPKALRGPGLSPVDAYEFAVRFASQDEIAGREAFTVFQDETAKETRPKSLAEARFQKGLDIDPALTKRAQEYLKEPVTVVTEKWGVGFDPFLWGPWGMRPYGYPNLFWPGGYRAWEYPASVFTQYYYFREDYPQSGTSLQVMITQDPFYDPFYCAPYRRGCFPRQNR